MIQLTRIQGYAHIAIRYGFEEAVFLDAIYYWYRTNRADNRNFRDGRWWTYNSVAAFNDMFPWWSAKQIRRIAASCKEQGALITGNYNSDQRDRTIWYSPSDDLLILYGDAAPDGDAQSGHCICPNGQMDLPKRADSSAQTGEPLPCNNHVGTNMYTPYNPPEGDEPTPEPEPKPKPRRKRKVKSDPDYRPELFENFWEKYPGGGSRARAVAAWDALKPDDALIAEMARALKRQKASRMWQEGIGIPHASTWLNQRRWTDKLPEHPEAPHPSPGSGWANDPEVIT